MAAPDPRPVAPSSPDLGPHPDPTLALDVEALSEALGLELASRGPAARQIAIDPDRVQQDLARLVLALMELLRRLLELQAIRRMESGTLTEDEEERVGLGLLRAREAIEDVARKFDLDPAELSLRIQGLGKLF